MFYTRQGTGPVVKLLDSLLELFFTDDLLDYRSLLKPYWVSTSGTHLLSVMYVTGSLWHMELFMQKSASSNIWTYNMSRHHYLANHVQTSIFKIHIYISFCFIILFTTVSCKVNELTIYLPSKISNSHVSETLSMINNQAKATSYCSLLQNMR